MRVRAVQTCMSSIKLAEGFGEILEGCISIHLLSLYTTTSSFYWVGKYDVYFLTTPR